jgi:enoyl-CoA hydratase/carnithine racemase
MEFKVIQVTRQAGVGRSTLNRPHRHNAWTGRMHTEYRWALAELEADPLVRAVIVTGAQRSFCVGGDAQALKGHSDKGGYDPGTPDPLARPGYGVMPEFDAPFAYHFGLTKPVIAALNGAAAGVGLALAMFADLRFAVPGAVFTTAHGKLNFPAEYGLSWLLPRMIGLTRANELLLSSRRFSSEEALSLGLINGLYEADVLIDSVQAYAEQLIAQNAPDALRVTKHQIYRDLHRDVATSVHYSEQQLARMSRTPDFREGVAAFMEKRPPKWQGMDHE